MADDYDKWLAAARPHTAADDGWAVSTAGEEALARIHRAADRPSSATPWRRRPVRLFAGGLGLAAAAAVVTVVAMVDTSSPTKPPRVPPPHQAIGPRPENMALVAYDSCQDMLNGLRTHTAANVGPYGLPQQYPPYLRGAYDDVQLAGGAIPAAAQSAPDHSTTNVQEGGVDEPDIFKTDGDRVVSVTGGMLRVTDASTEKVTGSLDLTIYDGWQSAQLLVADDRALVILGSGSDYGGPIGARGGSIGASTYVLVDLSDQPKVLGTMHPTGGYVDARMTGSTVRLVVESAPKISVPFTNANNAQRTQRNRAAVQKAPLSAWLPTYDVTSGSVTTKRTVPCERVSHPTDYTGTSMLTIYTIDLSKDLGDAQPVSLAADGDTVYATSSSLYIASNPDWWSCFEVCSSAKPKSERTEIHRFDMTGDGRPTYLGSGSLPGRLLSQYSLSEYDGYLRIATTAGQFGAKTETSVYILAADTLKVAGHVGGLGKGEQIYAVRFLGELGYVVTFRQMDPLYVVDLRDPTAPRVASELTISGYSDYLHPVGAGRLVGVGQDATSQGRTTGMQVSLFDVSKPATPRRLARVVASKTPGGLRLDPHAFLYWPSSRLLVMPLQSWNADESGKALVLKVNGNTLDTLGTIANPSVSGVPYATLGIQRSFVIGDDIWTLSDSGLRVSDMATLGQQAWIAFS